MDAWRVAMKALGSGDIWNKSRYTVYVKAASISSAIKKARAWAKSDLRKVEIIEAVMVEGNVA